MWVEEVAGVGYGSIFLFQQRSLPVGEVHVFKNRFTIVKIYFRRFQYLFSECFFLNNKKMVLKQTLPRTTFSQSLAWKGYKYIILQSHGKCLYLQTNSRRYFLISLWLSTCRMLVETSPSVVYLWCPKFTDIHLPEKLCKERIGSLMFPYL